MSSTPESLFSEHLRETRRQLRALWLKIGGGGFAVVLLVFCLAWFFIQPAPPRDIHMAVGSTEGAYFQFANAYADELAKQGINLHLHTTNGSLLNYELLKKDNKIDLAFVQGGTAAANRLSDPNIESLASLYLEPAWVFYRSDEPYVDLRSLTGKRIAIGRLGSGTTALTTLILQENGITSDSAELLPIGGREAIRQLKEESIDAAFFVTSPSAQAVQSLANIPDLRLLDFDRHEAYARRHPFLSSVTLEEGVIDLENNYPKSKVHLIAPAANLIANKQLHDSLVPMLLRAADVVHKREPSLFQRGKLPSAQFIEFPLNESAERYFESGPPLLQKYLPFWIASFLDRSAILLLPALTLLLPLFKAAPPLYRWRIRSRIYRWYTLLREMETDLNSEGNNKKLHTHWKTLQIMETELDDLHNVPLAYMQEFYSLRLHIEFVERRLIRKLRLHEPSAEFSETTPSSPNDTQSENASHSSANILSRTGETIAIDSTVSFPPSEIASTEKQPDRNDPPSKSQS
ncbi:MAG TPA: C4-dicarboxylate ABC transporter substrate-binding protein [Rhodopirellula sp.]|nr:C4-dicarboxylate ABC transporter substrate-binding protein [Rhodopirellula sp.]